MSYIITYAPYCGILLLVVGISLLLSGQQEKLSRSQTKRLDRFFSLVDDDDSSSQGFSLWAVYQAWLTKFLLELGYDDKLEYFYSMTRFTFLFFLSATFILFYLSGSRLLTSLLVSILTSIVSLSIPHLVLFYLRSRQHTLIANEYLTVTNYILDALDGDQKDIFQALKEARSLITIIAKPLQNFVNRYISQDPALACDALLLEVPAPETEQFLSILSNGFEYHDRQNLMDYITALNNTKHSLVIQAKERKEKQRDTLYSLLIMIPALLTIAITLSTAYAKVSGVLSHTIW